MHCIGEGGHFRDSAQYEETFLGGDLVIENKKAPCDMFYLKNINFNLVCLYWSILWKTNPLHNTKRYYQAGGQFREVVTLDRFNQIRGKCFGGTLDRSMETGAHCRQGYS